MDVVVHVEPVHLVKNAAEETVPVPLIVPVVNVAMTVVEATLVVLVLTDKHAKMEFVLELESELAVLESVVTTELVDHAVLAQLDKDVEEESVNASTIVMTEIVELQLLMLDQSVLNKLAELAPVVLLAAPVDSALPLLLVTSISLLSIESPTLRSLDLVPLISVVSQSHTPEMDSYGLLPQLHGMLLEVLVHMLSELAVLDTKLVMRPLPSPLPLQQFS